MIPSFLATVLSIHPVAFAARLTPGGDACVERLTARSSLRAAAREFMALENPRYSRDLANPLVLNAWLKQYTKFMALELDTKPGPAAVLENLDAYLEATFFSMRWQWQRQAHLKMSEFFEYLVVRVREALLSKAATPRQIQKTLLREWKYRFSNHTMGGDDPERLLPMIEEVHGLLIALPTNPHGLNEVSELQLSAIYFLRGLQRELASVLSLNPENVRAYKHLPNIALNPDAPEALAIQEWTGGSPPDQSSIYVRQLLLELALAQRTGEWAGLTEEQLPAMRVVRRLQTLGFQDVPRVAYKREAK